MFHRHSGAVPPMVIRLAILSVTAGPTPIRMADYMVDIRILTIQDGRRHLPQLAAVLVDCVEGGASVGFTLPLTTGDAERFFEGVLEDVQNERRILLAAFSGSQLVGTVQIVPAAMPNQAHWADVAKLLVRRSARSQGVASALMLQVESVCRERNRTLLVLDTVTGGNAERLYTRLGWSKVGVIPNYALFPDGEFCDTTIFYKQLN